MLYSVCVVVLLTENCEILINRTAEQIDRQACFLDVGSSYHPAAEGGKCRAVRPLKGNVNDLALPSDSGR
jgi:hypothetical protein